MKSYEKRYGKKKKKGKERLEDKVEVMSQKTEQTFLKMENLKEYFEKWEDQPKRSNIRLK